MHLPNVIIAVFITWHLSLLNDSTDATVTGISLEGCFKNLSHYTTRRNLSDKNGPRHCFDECNNTEYIGLQKQDCFCNVTREAYATERDCGFSCPGDRSVSCGSDNTIYVYSKVQTNISVYGESGFVYLHVFKVSGNLHYYFLINGTNDITEKHHYICYDDPRKCELKTVEMTWQEAKTECLQHNQGLVPHRIAIDEIICQPLLPDGYFWIGMTWFMPVTTSTTVTSTSTTTTATSTSSISSKPSHSFQPTTGSRSTPNSATPVIEQTSKASSNGGVNVIAVAAPIAVIVVVFLAVLASILICKKRKLLCFKERHNSSELDESNSDALPEIPGLIASSVPPGSTIAPFQSLYHNGRPITASKKDIQSDKNDQTVLNSKMYSTNMGDNTQNRLRSDTKGEEKPKEKRENENKHGAFVDKEYEEIKANGKTNAEMLGRLTNDVLSVVNGRTGYPNGEGKVNEKKRKKKKKKRTREESYSDDKTNNASAEIHEIQRETQVETFAKEYDGLFVAPAETPIIEEQTYLNIERLGRKHKEKRRQEIERVNEDGAEQDGVNLNGMYKESNDGNIDIRKEKKKKRKKSRERSKENVHNYYDENVDAQAVTPVLEEQIDLQNEGSKKKQKKKKRKNKDKKIGDEYVAEQNDLDLDKDENDDATVHSF